jgi:hypothetical protein
MLNSLKLGGTIVTLGKAFNFCSGLNTPHKVKENGLALIIFRKLYFKSILKRAVYVQTATN